MNSNDENRLTDEELRFINQSMCKNPSRYNLQGGKFYFSVSDLEGIIQTVQTDLGKEVSKKILNHKGFKILGSRLFYPVIYFEIGTSNEVKYNMLCSSEDGGRGGIYLMELPKKKLIIKAYQTHNEEEIAKIASENGFGPTLYESKVELVEDYLSRLTASKKSKHEIGYQIGKLIRRCHNQNVIHTDLNETHIKFDPSTGEVKLIDFGVSHLFDNEGYIEKNAIVFGKALEHIMFPEGSISDRRGFGIYYKKDSNKYKLPLDLLKIGERNRFIDYIQKWGFSYGLFKHLDEKRFIEKVNEGYNENSF